MILRVLLATAAGLATFAAFPPVGIALLGPLGLALFLVTLRSVPPGPAALLGWIYALAYLLPLLWWLGVVGADVRFLVPVALSGWYALYGAFVALVGQRRFWPAWVTCGWVATETLRSAWPFGGLPWGRLGFSVPDTWWQPGLPWWGVTGMSAVLAGLGACLAWCVSRRWDARPTALRALAVLASTVLAGLAPGILGGPARPSGPSVRVAAIQGSVPGSGTDVLADVDQLTQNHLDATSELADRVNNRHTPRPDLVVWPENSTAIDPFANTSVRADIETASARIRAPILVGAMVDGPDSTVFNQGIVWDPTRGPGPRYTKRHPVPFAEYVPFRNGFLIRQIERLDLVPRDMIAGTRTTPLEVRGDRVAELRVADAICFDVAYDDVLPAQVRNGAQLVTVQTSNAMFLHTPQLDQQFQITRARAAETGRAVVVASINGISAVIGPDGSVVATAPRRDQAVVEGVVRLNEGTTPGVLLGPWVGRASVLISCVGLLLFVITYLRRGDRARPASRREGVVRGEMVGGTG